MEKHDIRLNNVLLPIWLMLAFPVMWLIVLPANFIIDSVVLIAALKYLGQSDIKALWKSSILKVWVLGFLCDFAGVAFLFSVCYIYGDGPFFDWLYDNVTTPVSMNPFASVWGVLAVLIAVGISGLCIYLADKHLAFRKLEVPPEVKTKLALIFAIVTAPWTFLLPSQWFWNSGI